MSTLSLPAPKGLLAPGRRVLRRLPLSAKLALMIGLPLLGLLWSLVQVGVDYLHQRHAILDRLQGIAALSSVRATQAALQQQRRYLTLPAAVSGGRPARPEAWSLSPAWQLDAASQAASRCAAAQLARQEPAAVVAPMLAAHLACLDQLDNLARAVALRSGLLRSGVDEGYLLADFWMHHVLPLSRAADRLTTLMGSPQGQAHLLPDFMSSWAQPGGTVDGLLNAATSQQAQAASMGFALPDGLSPVREAMARQSHAIWDRLQLGDLVPASQLPSRQADWLATDQALATLEQRVTAQLQATVQHNLAMATRDLVVQGGLMLGLMMAGVYLAAACAGLFISQVTGIRRVIEAHTHGRLEARVPVLTHDELGQIGTDMNVMGERLGELVARLRGSVQRIAALGDTLSVGAQSLAIRTEQQARELDESAQSVQQAAQGAGHCAELASQVQQVSQSLQAQAQQGSQEVMQAVAGMERMAQQSSQVREAMAAITAIALQTRLLSLNATIEAAHAGADGRGFSLIAGEVRALADRTAAAASQIDQLIAHSSEAIEQGLGQVRRIEALSTTVASHSVVTAERMRTIAEQSAAQSAAMVQLRATLADLAVITHANLDLVTVSADEAQRMRGCSDDLSLAVRELEGQPT